MVWQARKKTKQSQAKRCNGVPPPVKNGRQKRDKFWKSMVQKAKEAALAEAKKEAKKEVKRIFDLEAAAKKQAK